MTLQVNVDFKSGPSTPLELRLLSKASLSKNLMGHHHFWDGTRFLLEATHVKTARPQAERLVSAWCCFAAALEYEEHPSSGAYMANESERVLRSEMGRWLEELDRPRKEQLDKAQTRKRIREISARAVKEFEEFRTAFDIAKRGPAAGLDGSLLRQSWCIPAIDRRLEYWRDQLAFIEMRMAEEGDG